MHDWRFGPHQHDHAITQWLTRRHPPRPFRALPHQGLMVLKRRQILADSQVRLNHMLNEMDARRKLRAEVLVGPAHFFFFFFAVSQELLQTATR